MLNVCAKVGMIPGCLYQFIIGPTIHMQTQTIISLQPTKQLLMQPELRPIRILQQLSVWDPESGKIVISY